MDDAEKLVSEHLVAQGFRSIVFEPDGNRPPDFSIEERIAVEVTRLQWTWERRGRKEGLREVEAPLVHFFISLFEEFGPPTEGVSWFVIFRFRRPLNQKVIRRRVKRILTDFKRRPHPDWQFRVCQNFELQLIRSTAPSESFYQIGAIVDQDSGGFVVPNTVDNIYACLEEKTRKTAPFRHRYGQWWLVLVDQLSFGLGQPDREEVQRHISRPANWERLLIIDYRTPSRWFEVP